MMKIWIVIFLSISFAITVNAFAEEKEELWDIGAGLRFNYLRLTGGISGYDAETGNRFDIDYSAIGTDNPWV